MARPLRNLQVGRPTLDIILDNQGKLAKLRYPQTVRTVLEVTSAQTKSGYQIKLVNLPVTIRQKKFSIRLQTALFTDARHAGLSPKLIYQIIKNASWDINFAHDLNPGDEIFAIVEENCMWKIKKRGWVIYSQHTITHWTQTINLYSLQRFHWKSGILHPHWIQLTQSIFKRSLAL